jgi:4-amino-4-deoxy-L-arabinose transferase-like glycosyltransferase
MPEVSSIGEQKTAKTRIAANLPWRQIVLVLVLILIIWLPRGFELDRYVATDEVAWLVRSANFYYALGQKDYAATYIKEHPGVVTMWAGTAAYMLDFPEYRGFGQGYFDADKYWMFEDFVASHGVDPHDVLVTTRVIMVIINTLLIAAAFVFARLLFGTFPTLIGFLLIAFDPFHVSVTRLAHLDGPVSSFLFLSVLSFLAYLYCGRRLFYLLISAIAGGLAVLAKLPGLIIVPAVVLIALTSYFNERKDTLRDNAERAGTLAGLLIKPLLLWGTVFIISIVIFFPAMWVNPINNLKQLMLSPLTAGRVVQVVEDDLTSGSGGEIKAAEIRFPFSSKSIEYYLRYPRRYLWNATPVILFGLVAALAAYVFKFSLFKAKKVRKAVVGLLLFLVVYTLFLTFASKTSDKYYIPVYPVLDLIAGLGCFACVDWIGNLKPFTGKKIFPYLALSAIILVQIVGTMPTYPYYSVYFNPLLGGSRRAGEVLSVGSGEGLDLAAEYLNDKPDAENLKAISWYGNGPFSYYFVGETRTLWSYIWDEKKISELKEMDYLVVYSTQWSRGMPVGLFPHLAGVEPEHSVWINSIEYARIYDVNTLPPEIYEPYELKK